LKLEALNKVCSDIELSFAVFLYYGDDRRGRTMILNLNEATKIAIHKFILICVDIVIDSVVAEVFD